jgi:glucan phosphorylase
MSEELEPNRTLHNILPMEIEGVSSLAELALDLRWSWNHGADCVWKRLDPALWELTSNPWVILQTVSREKLHSLLADPAFREEVDTLVQKAKRAASSAGWFQQKHPQYPGQLPITPLRRPDGQWLRLEIALPGYSVWLRAWQVQIGGVKLYLLDSNDGANFPAHRGITSELYGGGPELRLKQEMLLGIGGWRLLGALGIQPEICHLNEGHAAFAVLERARSCMSETGQTFEAALVTTRAGNLFTTHTAVAAGFDRFPPALIGQYLAGYAREKLGISLEDLLALGRQNPEDASEPFNMAYLAVRGSGSVNGVSCLHGQVSRRLFGPLFPRWPTDEVPIGFVTNGVHMPTWDSAAADKLWTEACGKDRWLGTTENLEQDIRRVPDAQGIPTAWVARMRESMARLTPRFSATRAVREYTEQHYLPGAVSYRRRAADKGATGKEIVDWRRDWEAKRATLRFGEVKIESDGEQHRFEVEVYFNQLSPNAARVELYASGTNGDGPSWKEMTRTRQLGDAAAAYAYRVQVPAGRPATDYTARVIPYYDGVAVPLEANRILWQR